MYTRAVVGISAALIASVFIPIVTDASQIDAVSSQDYPKIANLYAFDRPNQTAAMSGFDLFVGAGDKQFRVEHPSKVFLHYFPTQTVYTPTYNGQSFNGVKIYSGWWLTFAGTQLDSSINATTTTIAVRDAQIIQASLKTNPYILVGAESMLVTSVDTKTNTLTVVRGIYSKPTAHKSGDRVAAHAGNGKRWDLNVTPYCPKDPSTGETWGDYLVGTIDHYLKTHPQTGVYLDNAKLGHDLSPDYSMIDANGDGIADGSNGPSGDGWMMGEQAIASRVRADNPNVLIMANSSDVIHDVNGEEFEHFSPAQAVSGLSHYLNNTGSALGGGFSVINPDTNNTGMQNLQLLRFGLAFALMGNGYFAYDYGGDHHGNTWWYDEYDNGAGSSLVEAINATTTELHLAPGAGKKYKAGDVVMVPDSGAYQANDEQMLVVAVDGDLLEVRRGYNGTVATSHQVLTKVMTQAQLSAGLGWLGQPIGPAYSLDTLTSRNLVRNGSFSGAHSGWVLGVENPAQASLKVQKSSQYSGAVQVTTTVAEPNHTWHVSLLQSGLALQAGQAYTLSFDVKSSDVPEISAQVQKTNAPWTQYSCMTFSLSPTWTHEQMSFVASNTTTNAKVEFCLAKYKGEVTISNVSLKKGDPNLWRRDFTNGTVILNATPSTHTVQLGSGYRHIAGSQNPGLNDGQPVSEVTVGPDDAVLLVKNQAVK